MSQPDRCRLILRMCEPFGPLRQWRWGHTPLRAVVRSHEFGEAAFVPPSSTGHQSNKGVSSSGLRFAFGSTEGKFYDAMAWLDGIVAKRRDRPYRSGRSPDWIKVK